ncbi:MAG: PHP domain-containing protein [Actinomycetes bacterium]
MRIDLHSHSTASDGTEPPAEVVRRAAEAGLDVLALTDHDTTAGLEEAAASLPPGLTLVPGIEISCAYEGISLHLLAYLADGRDAALAGALERLRADRLRRGEAMVERCVALGAPLSWERVRALAGDGAVGRPHVARALAEAGVVASTADAFTPDWIGDGGRAYVPKEALDTEEAIGLVREAGGVSVFAHPLAESRGPVVDDTAIRTFAAVGLLGLEVDHPDHTAAHRAHLRRLADELGLLVTGSSDDHGSMTGHRLGTETTSPESYARILAAATGTPLAR